MAGFGGNISLSNMQFRDPVLTSLIQGYRPYGFIVDDVLRRVPMTSPFTRLGKWGGDHLRLENTVQVGPGNIPYITMSMTSSDMAEPDNHMIKSWYGVKDRYELGGDTAVQAAWSLMLADNLMIGREYTLASYVFNVTGTNISQTSSPTPAWSDFTTSPSSILTDFATARKTVFTGCGYEPNTVILSWDVWNILSAHPTLINIATGNAYANGDFHGTLTVAKLAEAMKVDRILIGRAQYNIAKKGQAKSLSPIWPSGGCLFAYCNPNIQGFPIGQQSLGYSFVPGSTDLGYEVYAYTERGEQMQPWMGQWVIAGRMYDDHITDSNCAYFFSSCI